MQLTESSLGLLIVMMIVMSEKTLAPSNSNGKTAEPADHRLELRILARCIGTALNLGSPLKIAVYYVPTASH